MSRIVRVIPKEEYCLEVVLDNESSVKLSLKSRIGTIRFGILADQEFWVSEYEKFGCGKLVCKYPFAMVDFLY